MSTPRTKHTRCPDCQWDKNLQSVTWLTCAACCEARSPACPHGIPHEQRKRDGCATCDQDRTAQAQAERDAATFRARVIQTARVVLPAIIAHAAAHGISVVDATVPATALDVAETFERQADEYLKGDKP